MTGRLAALRKQRLFVQLGVLALAVALAFAVISPLAGWLRGAAGLAAAGAAAGACFVGAATALGVSRSFSDPAKAWIGPLAAMIPRMAVPMGFVLVVYGLGGPLIEAGFLYYLIVFYSYTLAVDTMLLLPETGSRPPTGKP